ncbi:endonuclease/exonuclease/phosphatase domain-containing protein [Tieghemostelium lacteum]|uniref:Endonuclease/exonuclease/phosphatase domain-containing protein n=1 Tax=Tieghemostelium lacteum TaxID=361077 RepID=A0A151Z4Z6_TIELA|nr:endonuclease/exonuclease/phosphatase domain-containing protein [Tieghemostelium lacteum]|eukprot:KYQ89049.1 endonuclease/exonuclease/phosphatase domain-containing protein [Tieghemostelium lacteum]
MVSFFIVPETLVVNVPTYICYQQTNSTKTVIPESAIKSIQWFVNDKEVQHYPSVSDDHKEPKKESLFQKIFKLGKEESGSEIKKNWFVPDSSHVGGTLKVRVVLKIKELHEKSEHVVEVLSNGTFTTHPTRQMYIYNSESDENDFGFTTYNIMADCYTHPGRYKTPEYALFRPYRKHLMAKYINFYKSDIVCLQEFEPEFTEVIKEMDEEGLTSTPTIIRDGSRYQPPDQCISFYRRSRFHLIQQHIIDYNIITSSGLISKEQIEKLKSNPVTNHFLEGVLKTNHHNRFSFLHLTDLKTSKPLIVINVHLYWGAPTEDWNYKLQLMQFYIITLILDDYTAKHSPNTPIPIILCGDLNNEPHQKVNKFITQGVYNENHEKDLYTFKHSYKFSSVYANHPMGETSFTIATKSYQKCIDYIYITKSNITVKSWLEVGNHYSETLPSVTEPSDHILLKANLNLNSEKLNTTEKKIDS